MQKNNPYQRGLSIKKNVHLALRRVFVFVSENAVVTASRSTSLYTREFFISRMVI
jgi:hypothetical protein